MAHGISINHQSLWIQYISAKFAEAQFTDSWVQLFSCACVFVENSFSLAAFYGLLPCPWARVREHKRIIYSTSSRACVVPCSLPLCHNIRCVSWHAAGSLRALSLCTFFYCYFGITMAGSQWALWRRGQEWKLEYRSGGCIYLITWSWEQIGMTKKCLSLCETWRTHSQPYLWSAWQQFPTSSISLKTNCDSLTDKLSMWFPMSSDCI